MQIPRREKHPNHSSLPASPGTADEREEPDKIIETIPQAAPLPESEGLAETEIKPLSDFVL